MWGKRQRQEADKKVIDVTPNHQEKTWRFASGFFLLTRALQPKTGEKNWSLQVSWSGFETIFASMIILL
jgi:hypothetical protein